MSLHLQNVRQTAARSGNTPWRHVRRISVVCALLCTPLIAGSSAKAAPPAPSKEPWEIRIIPATKMMFPPPMNNSLPGPPQNPNEMPEGPTERARGPQQGADQARMAAIPPGAIYYHIWKSIPFSNAEYHANPSYRNEATLSLIFNQMPYYSIVKEQSNLQTPLYGYPTPFFYSTRNPQ